VVQAIVTSQPLKYCLHHPQRINRDNRTLKNSQDGEKSRSTLQTVKGMIREFEEELVWAHFGVQVKDVHHLRLGFYTGDIFTEQPDKKRDVEPRSEEHTSELQSRENLVCRLLLEKKKNTRT